MVRQYIFKVLIDAWNATKGVEKKRGRLTFHDWAYFDGDDIPWQNQTYSQPQLKRQPIGWENVLLTGGRSYQLKWMARGRLENRNENECGGSDQMHVQPCSDRKLLTQGKMALQEDYISFGLLEQYHSSLCMLHYITRVPWPVEDPKVCKENIKSLCIKNNTCAISAVCPSISATEHVKKYRDNTLRQTKKLIYDIEQPELSLLSFAQTLFEERYQRMSGQMKCDLAAGLISRSESWLGDGCFPDAIVW